MNKQKIYDFERSLAKIYAQAYNGTETQPGEAYFYLKNIPKIIEECEKADVAIWRIEGFRLIEEKYHQPSLAWIHDMPDKKDEEAWSEYRKKCNEEADNYLKDFREKNEVEPEFDIVITLLMLGEEEWQDIRKRQELEKKEEQIKKEKQLKSRIKTRVKKWFS